ncbi:MAG TPA: fatty acid--CoA ligase family protein [Anaerolineales bacterium]|nr:fatty acid--CoA ligase family protein [Anaerolineales bacterium]
MIEFLLKVFKENANDDAIIWRDRSFSYQWLHERVLEWQQALIKNNVLPGSVVILEADFSPNAIALFLALIEQCCILVPLTKSVEAKKAEFIEIAEGEMRIVIAEDDSVVFDRLPHHATHSLYAVLRARRHPGLILFSSGSTGKSKAALHDLTGILEKFKVRRHKQRTITFLLYDHIGGVNTMLHTLSNGGCIVTVQERSPEKVLEAIEKHRVELLPTSPTFINMILLSEAYKHYDLSSLKMVTYGTEPMPESTLKRFHELFPHITLQQTYGLSEVGILRSKSKSSDSLWVRLGGEGFETRVVDGILHIKAQSAMLGYLNAPSPFTEDGWFITGDEVEVDGEYFRILGRRSELINVGGEKVYPAEVESVIQQVDNVAEVVVYGEKNPITGSIVCADVRLREAEDPKAAALRIKKYCRAHMPAFKVPVKVNIVDEDLHGERFKKMRLRS